jgi:hypothetical protein
VKIFIAALFGISLKTKQSKLSIIAELIKFKHGGLHLYSHLLRKQRLDGYLFKARLEK